MWPSRPLTLAVLTVVLGTLGACGNDWRTDMWFQPSHRPQSMPRPEPSRSVALGAGPAPLADIDDSDELRNPEPADARSLARGGYIFRERCIACHGPQGHGGGPVSKFFPPAPDLAYPAIVARTDGHLFGTVTLGGRAMPPQAAGLTTRDRWDVVNFVRALQRGTTP